MNLSDVFSYDSETGIITWKISPNRGVLAGDVAGSEDGGYIRIRYQGTRYKAHNLAWFLYHGEWPDGLLDHDNTIRSDNRISNLRPATTQENNRNAVHRLGESGVRNVTRCGRTGKWRVRLMIDSKHVGFGYYEDLELADLVATEARNKLFGKFANHGGK